MSGTPDPTVQVAKSRTNRIAVGVSIGVLAVGGAIVFFSDLTKWPVNLGLAGGSGLIAVGALSLLSEIFLRRSLRQELLTEVNGRAQAEKVGLRDALTSTRDYMTSFTDLLPAAKRVDLMFNTDNSWVDSQTSGLTKALKKACRMRVVLPNYTEPEVISQILRRFDVDDKDMMEAAIRLAELSVIRLRTKFPAKYDEAGRLSSGVEVRRSNTIPTYSYYRVGDVSVIRLQEVQKKQVSDTPVLVIARGGAYWKFANNDFDEVFEASTVVP
jgi:hypothetical protein